MREIVIENLASRFQSYADVIEQVDDATITARIDVPKHKTLGEHVWCVVGARESFAKSLEAGEWLGFACSMSTS